MTPVDKLLVIYLIGLVFFTSAGYLLLRPRGVKNLEYLSTIWGIFWPLLLVFWIVQAVQTRRKVKS